MPASLQTGVREHQARVVAGLVGVVEHAAPGEDACRDDLAWLDRTANGHERPALRHFEYLEWFKRNFLIFNGVAVAYS
jgi:hypothetical protein